MNRKGCSEAKDRMLKLIAECGDEGVIQFFESMRDWVDMDEVVDAISNGE